LGQNGMHGLRPGWNRVFSPSAWRPMAVGVGVEAETRVDRGLSAILKSY
jgi:hypothetical protein